MPTCASAGFPTIISLAAASGIESMTGPCPDEPEIPFLHYGEKPPSVSAFRRAVLRFYRNHGRDLAWRRTTDPYCILVSEIMLQQTQVDRVSRKYTAFVAAFPDFPALAAAPLPDLLSAWQGLGYNRRAIALQKCARRVTEEFGGSLPDDPEVLETFPGIGKATAASICAFAFNRPGVFIETNIRRVFIHSFFPEDRQVRDEEILPLVERTLYRKNPRVWYWALMDLGSALKQKVPNPNRKSAGYIRQPPFAGSDREIRGKILRILLECPDGKIADLAGKTGCEPVKLRGILAALEKEGFLTVRGSQVRLFPD